jgi:hypothetical protein
MSAVSTIVSRLCVGTRADTSFFIPHNDYAQRRHRQSQEPLAKLIIARKYFEQQSELFWVAEAKKMHSNKKRKK